MMIANGSGLIVEIPALRNCQVSRGILSQQANGEQKDQENQHALSTWSHQDVAFVSLRDGNVSTSLAQFHLLIDRASVVKGGEGQSG
jgi:hypothetical protein